MAEIKALPIWGDEILQSLRHDNMVHDLPIAHAHSLSALQLSLVNAADGPAHGLGHVGADVQGEHNNTSGEGGDIQSPEGHGAVVDSGGLHIMGVPRKIST